MFCVGDIVVYGAQGLCKVDGIGPLPMKFADKSKRYYTLHTCKQPSMTIYAPVDNQTVVMRQPLNRAQAETLISEMPHNMQLSPSWMPKSGKAAAARPCKPVTAARLPR